MSLQRRKRKITKELVTVTCVYLSELQLSYSNFLSSTSKNLSDYNEKFMRAKYNESHSFVMIIFVVKGEPFRMRSQPTELQNKKDWFEVNNNQAFLAKFDNSLGLSACCVGTRHVTKLRRKYSLHTGITSDLDTVSKITRSNIRVIMPRKARSLSKRKTM